MADEKKVVFSAQDNISQKASQIYDGLLKKAKQQTDSLREQNRLIEEQYRLLKKQEEDARKESKKEVKSFFDASKGAKSSQEASYYYKQGASAEERLKKESINSQEGFNLLKDLVNQFKKAATSSEKIEKETIKENQRKSKYEDLNLARREARADPKGIRKKFAQTEADGYGDMTSEQIEKLHYQKSIVDREKPDAGMYRTIVGAVMTSQAIGTMMGGIKTMMASPTGVQGLTSLASGAGQGIMGAGIAKANPYIAAGGAIIDLASSLFGGSVDARYALRPGFNRMGARSNGRAGLGGNVGLGYTSLDAQGLQEGLMGAAGGTGSLNRLTSQAQIMQRGLGLSESSLINIVSQMKNIGAANDITNIVSKVLKSNPDLVKNPVMLERVIQAQMGLTHSLSQQTETVSAGRVAGFMGGLRSAGGNMANSPEFLAQVGSQINQSLSSPSNDFQKARSFGVLSGINPGASYFQLLKMREQGIGQEGYVEGMLKQLQRETGGGENFALAAMQNFGLQAGTSEKLTTMFEKNPNMFAGFKGGSKEIEDMVSQSRAERFTPENAVVQATAEEQKLLGTFNNLAGIWGKITSAFTANTESSNALLRAIESKYNTGIYGPH